jgi:hypothetical protein
MNRIRKDTGPWAVAVAVVLMGCQETQPLGTDLEEAGFTDVDALAGRTLALQGKNTLDLDLCDPSAGGFSAVSTNPYFPFEPGDQWYYGGVEDGTVESLVITALDQTRLIDGVTTRVIEERESVDGELLEISWNYYAQAADGTVCYFGEDVDIYEPEGDIVHDGAWCADDPGNAAGIIMPADPEPGLRYQNELAPGIAEDRAKIVGSGPVTVTAGTFAETILVRETNPLDGDTGFKTFAAGMGLIIDGPVELFHVEEDAPFPGPPSITQQSCGS